jgi:hypothetical protein
MDELTEVQALALLRSLIHDAKSRAMAGDVQGLADLATIQRLCQEEIDSRKGSTCARGDRCE